jgi:hypothetical protein
VPLGRRSALHAGRLHDRWVRGAIRHVQQRVDGLSVTYPLLPASATVGASAP